MRSIWWRTIHHLTSVCCLALYMALTEMLLVYVDSHLALEAAREVDYDVPRVVVQEVVYSAQRVVVQEVEHIVHVEADILLPN